MSRRISQLPLIDQPREKLRRKGAAALSDFELLEVLIGSGAGKSNVSSIARRVHRQLQAGADAFNYDSLVAIKGIDIAHAGKLLSALNSPDAI